jgi:HAD superfamily hydrolase (TIGR01509 family)
VHTAIVSNSADGARREEISRYAFDEVFDPIIYSHEVGLAKPDPAIFELVCSRLGVAPAETIFVDDVPGHCEAARRVGMHAIQHRGTPQTVAAITARLAG